MGPRLVSISSKVFGLCRDCFIASKTVPQIRYCQNDKAGIASLLLKLYLEENIVAMTKCTKDMIKQKNNMEKGSDC